MIIEQLFGNMKFTGMERQIAEFIDKNPRLIVNLSLEDFSRLCYVSQASVIRFCKKLGTKGFADFKIKLASEVSVFITGERDIHIDMPIGPKDSCEDIAETFYKLSAQTLKATHDRLDFDALRKAARLFAKADIIHTYGRGESQILAEDFHYKLIRIGYHSTLEPMNGFQEAKCLHSSTRISQAALVVSHYCNSRHITYVIDELVSGKIPFVLLTAAQNPKPYDSLAAVTLKVVSAESRFKMGSFVSKVAMQYVLDCLFGQIFSLQYDRNKENLIRFSQRKVARSYFYSPSSQADRAYD